MDTVVSTIFDSYLVGGDESELSWQSGVFQIAASLARDVSAAPHPRRRGRYRHLLSDLQTSCTAELTVAALAEREHVTASALSKGFQREVGISLSAYMTQLLVDRACELLASTDLSAQAVAEKLGYVDPFYFHRVFKKHTGASPLAYRRMAADSKRFG
jgi:two-component system response regulator YesN